MDEVRREHLAGLEPAIQLAVSFNSEASTYDILDELEAALARASVAPELMNAFAEIARLRAEVLSEYRNACIASNNSFVFETDTLEEAVKVKSAAEDRLEAALDACWAFYRSEKTSV